MLNRTAAATIAAAATLARAWAADGRMGALRAADIAEHTGLPRPFVAKLLVRLAARGLVTGVRGRRGGYRLARPPSSISLADVLDDWARAAPEASCPFARRLCAEDQPCPLRRRLCDARRDADALFRTTTLAAFLPRERPRRPEARAGAPQGTGHHR